MKVQYNRLILVLAILAYFLGISVIVDVYIIINTFQNMYDLSHEFVNSTNEVFRGVYKQPQILPSSAHFPFKCQKQSDL